jgi:tRNA G18 (ribose-2'-O)-methylase SpoU
MHIERITSFDRPELAPYATLRQHEGHKTAGIFVAEGAKVVRRLLESDFGVVSVLLPEKRFAEFEPLIRARTEDVPVFIMEIAELEKLTGFPFFQGVLAVGRIPQTHTVESILATAPRPYFFVAVDGLANAENIGLIVRSSAGFGAQALIVGENSGSPFLRRAVRNSMGAIFKLPIVQCGSLECRDLSPASFSATPDSTEGKTAKSRCTPTLVATLTALRVRKVPVIAAHPRADGRTIHDVNFATDCCLVFGSEGQGVSKEVLAVCDEAVAIPMSNEVDSLNVGTAAAVFLYEVARQRKAAD